MGLRPPVDPQLQGLRALVNFASKTLKHHRIWQGGASSLVKARDAVQLRVRHLVVDQLDVQPELPPGWELLGAELVFPDKGFPASWGHLPPTGGRKTVAHAGKHDSFTSARER